MRDGFFSILIQEKTWMYYGKYYKFIKIKMLTIGKNSGAWSDGWFNLYEKSKGV